MASYREILSGSKRGLWPSCTRGLLACAEIVYSSAIASRNRRFDRGGKAVQGVAVPVISVGNVTTGGTGKTPFVAWLATWCRQRAMQVAIVSRGYGAKAGEKNDEALELELRLPEVAHIQNPDRVAGAHQAIVSTGAQLILLDDGFQHRRIHRDLDIVLIDALEPFGYGHLLPRGLLREPLSSLSRAHVVAMSRADLVTAETRAEIWSAVRRHAPRTTLIEVAHRPRQLIGKSKSELIEPSLLSRWRVAVFCGIGNPPGFRHTLEKLGATVCGFREFADHHRYTTQDIDELARAFDSLDVDAVVCTLKDFVKLPVDKLGRHRLYALAIELEILSGLDEFESQLSAIVARENED